MGGRLPRRSALVAVGVLAVGACARQAGGDLAGAGPIDQVGPDALVPMLLVDDDEVGATSYGPLPMTSENRGDDYYQAPPTELCEEVLDVELVARDDVYAYLGEGGDYLYIDHWLSGESSAAATTRFDDGIAAIARCDGPLRELDVSQPGIDDVRRYAAGDNGTDGSVDLVYARHGGVVMLLIVTVMSTARYDSDDVDHVIGVALDKLTTAHVEVVP